MFIPLAQMISSAGWSGGLWESSQQMAFPYEPLHLAHGAVFPGSQIAPLPPHSWLVNMGHAERRPWMARPHPCRVPFRGQPCVTSHSLGSGTAREAGSASLEDLVFILK